MKEEDGVKLSQTLYARAEKIWPRYLCHPFVTQMADGTLPPEKFRYYMLQDYLYLKDYVKIFAAIIQKADDFEQIRFLSGELADTIGETFRTHIPYMKRLGITEEEISTAPCTSVFTNAIVKTSYSNLINYHKQPPDGGKALRFPSPSGSVIQSGFQEVELSPSQRW